jgi:soluble lytic murein transglycosylase-like protein
MIGWKHCIISASLCVSTSLTHAADSPEMVLRQCIDKAAATFGIPALPVHILREVEAGEVGKVSAPNKDGSYDIGPMQINSSWLPKVNGLGISESDLRDNGCINAYVGTWIYYQTWLDANRDTAMAMARYNSSVPRYQTQYLDMVLKVIDRRIGRQSIATR